MFALPLNLSSPWNYTKTAMQVLTTRRVVSQWYHARHGYDAADY